MGLAIIKYFYENVMAITTPTPSSIRHEYYFI
jgi:hypothetical protein